MLKKTLITNKEIKKQQGKHPSSLIPQDCQTLLESNPFSQPTEFRRDFPQISKPYDTFAEWPSETEIANYNFFNLAHESQIPVLKRKSELRFHYCQTDCFIDSFEPILPPSIETSKLVKWKRISDYIVDNELINEIKSNSNSALTQLEAYRIMGKVREIYFVYVGKDKELLSSKDAVPRKPDSVSVSSNRLHTEKKSLNSMLEDLGDHKRYFRDYVSFIERARHYEVVKTHPVGGIQPKEENSISKLEKEESHLKDNIKSSIKKVHILPVSPMKGKPNQNNVNSNYDVEPEIHNIEYSGTNAKFFNWLGSLFQFIIDNNLGYKENLLKRIYPQVNGYPTYNPNGKYWVKLFFNGKERKVEIDDFIPIGVNEQPYFPRCANIYEIWPLILAKALTKLYAYKYKDANYVNFEVGDCCYLYSLANLHNESVSPKNTESLKYILRDESYLNSLKYCIMLNKDQSIRTYCSSENINDLESSLISLQSRQNASIKRINKFNIINVSPKRLNEIEEEADPSFQEDRKRSNSKNKTIKASPALLLKDSILYNREIPKIKSSLKSNIAYFSQEIFMNGDFNMRRLRLLDFSDLKQKINDNKLIYKQLNKEQKIKYLEDLTKLKREQKQIMVQRIDELRLQGESYSFVKLLNQGINSGLSSFSNENPIPFSGKEINFAKICLLNNWKYPNIDYYQDLYIETKDTYPEQHSTSNKKLTKSFMKKKTDESFISKTENSNNNKNDSKKWNKDIYLSLLAEQEQDHQKVDLINRVAGFWLDSSCLPFNEVIVLHNINSYRYRHIWDFPWINSTADMFSVSNDDIALTLKYVEHQRLHSLSKALQPDEHYSCLFHFNPMRNQFSTEGNFFALIKLIDMESHEFTKITLSSTHPTLQLDNMKKHSNYYLILEGGMHPYGFTVEVLSESHEIKTISYDQYLKSQSFDTLNFDAFFPSLEEGKYYLISKFLISIAKRTQIKISVTNPDVFLNLHFKILLQDSKNKIKKQIYTCDFFMLDYLDEDLNYIVSIEITPSFNVQSGSLVVSFNYSSGSEIKIKELELIEPYEVKNKLKPNKYGFIFQLFLYPPEISYASISLSLVKESEKTSSDVSSAQVTMDKINSKLKKTQIITNQPLVKHYAILEENVKLSCEIKLRGDVVLFEEFWNHIDLHNLIFEGKLDSSKKSDSFQASSQKKKSVTVAQEPFVPYEINCYVNLTESGAWWKVSTVT